MSDTAVEPAIGRDAQAEPVACDGRRDAIALQACLPILHLGLDWYAGWVGIVVRGGIRDIAALATMPIGVLALGTHPRKSARVGQGLAGVPIEIDGERFVPGDVLYADEDGIVVLAAAG